MHAAHFSPNNTGTRTLPTPTRKFRRKYIFQVENVHRRHYYNTGDSAKCLKVFLIRSFVTIFDKYPSFKYLTNGSIKNIRKMCNEQTIIHRGSPQSFYIICFCKNILVDSTNSFRVFLVRAFPFKNADGGTFYPIPSIPFFRHPYRPFSRPPPFYTYPFTLPLTIFLIF